MKELQILIDSGVLFYKGITLITSLHGCLAFIFQGIMHVYEMIEII